MEIAMNKKFELTNESIYCCGCGVTVYRIKALKDFGKVKAGDLGGFIEKESNLSQENNCWLYDNAAVCDDATVYGNAEIYDNVVVCDRAKVYGNTVVSDNAIICGDAMIYDNAKIYGNAIICDDACVFGRATVCDKARVFRDATIFGNAVICDNAVVYGHTQVCDDTKICNNAQVYGEVTVCDNAIVNKEMDISSGKFTINTLEESIRCQTGLAPCNGEVIAYKRVSKDLNSLYDHKFKYVVGEWAEAENPEISDKSCASGLHFSNATYWDRQVDISNTILLIAKIRIEDIITVQRGKIRCRRAFIMGTYNI